ncbi:teleost multiple tissue opsin a [Danio rerio]|uniref:Teleost multiple tissue opsin a n=1 Tax=Danio rerio TaxID=7955 RepID=B3DK10_DANRE|nr:teleost multiple tissue opsin a [Danio rerio]AAI63681.1 Tmtops protein [Danio rerio]ALG92551.1 teleost multiple tissue opsin-3a [Danio rerio]|eukprot:NP_001112371.1 teleost multiple tissue opsin a [Danio rerio]
MIVSNLSVLSCRRNSALCLGAVEGHLEASSSYRTLSPTGHILVAVSLGFIGTFGFLNNLLVLVLFGRYKVLRSPINFLLVNICLSDLLVCVLGTPFSFAASTQGRWLIGDTGCVWYGFANSLLGIVSLISLAVLSYERYCTMMGSTEADATNYKKVIGGVLMSWIYSLIWTLPPLFGWSRYGPEGPGTTCSVDWTTKTANNISYIICLFIFCLIVPFLVIIFCYGKLLHAIKQVSSVNTSVSRKREHRVLLMVITMVVFYLLCWLPYGIMALLATFGAPGLVTAEASIVPSILAKSSTVINPVIYIFMNKQFYRCFRALLNCDKPQRGSSLKSSSKTKPFRPGRRTDNFTFMVASVGPNQTNPVEDGPPSADNTKPAVLSLVAHYNG